MVGRGCGRYHDAARYLFAHGPEDARSAVAKAQFGVVWLDEGHHSDACGEAVLRPIGSAEDVLAVASDVRIAVESLVQAARVAGRRIGADALERREGSQMPTFYVSPCGTSLLTNGAPEDLRNLLAQRANSKEYDLTRDEKARIDDWAKKQAEALTDASLEIARKLSAELNGLIAAGGGEFRAGSGTPDCHLLLCTDTYLGRCTGEIIESWLEGRGYRAEARVVPGLATNTLINFREALAQLAKELITEISDYRHSQYQIVFNLTGGFKAVQGFLQALGSIYADRCVYIFERSPELMVIPRLPVVLQPDDTMEKHKHTFRKLAAKYELPVAECRDIPETLLLEIDNKVLLSEWGEVLWAGFRDRLYRQDLMQPLSARLKYSDQFKKQAKNLSEDRLVILNDRLDELARFLDTGQEYNPKSLSFTKLVSKDKQPSTHEFYAWSDRDAKRCFGHYEKDIFVVDSLDKHM